MLTVSARKGKHDQNTAEYHSQVSKRQSDAKNMQRAIAEGLGAGSTQFCEFAGRMREISSEIDWRYWPSSVSWNPPNPILVADAADLSVRKIYLDHILR